MKEVSLCSPLEFKELCVSETNEVKLKDVLKSLFDPFIQLKIDRSKELISLISGGLDLEDFKAKGISFLLLFKI